MLISIFLVKKKLSFSRQRRAATPAWDGGSAKGVRSGAAAPSKTERSGGNPSLGRAAGRQPRPRLARNGGDPSLGRTQRRPDQGRVQGRRTQPGGRAAERRSRPGRAGRRRRRYLPPARARRSGPGLAYGGGDLGSQRLWREEGGDNGNVVQKSGQVGIITKPMDCVGKIAKISAPESGAAQVITDLKGSEERRQTWIHRGDKIEQLGF